MANGVRGLDGPNVQLVVAMESRTGFVCATTLHHQRAVAFALENLSNGKAVTFTAKVRGEKLFSLTSVHNIKIIFFSLEYIYTFIFAVKFTSLILRMITIGENVDILYFWKRKSNNLYFRIRLKILFIFKKYLIYVKMYLFKYFKRFLETYKIE